MKESAVIFHSDMALVNPIMEPREKENSSNNDERHQDPHIMEPDSFFHDLLMEQQEQQ